VVLVVHHALKPEVEGDAVEVGLAGLHARVFHAHGALDPTRRVFELGTGAGRVEEVPVIAAAGDFVSVLWTFVGIPTAGGYAGLPAIAGWQEAIKV
jgi:hypothetical protein